MSDTKEYKVIAEEGITVDDSSTLSSQDELVLLTDEQAAPFLEAGSIELVAEKEEDTE